MHSSVIYGRHFRLKTGTALQPTWLLIFIKPSPVPITSVKINYMLGNYGYLCSVLCALTPSMWARYLLPQFKDYVMFLEKMIREFEDFVSKSFKHS